MSKRNLQNGLACLHVARLVFSSDHQPGIRRIKRQKTFTYFNARGRSVTGIRAVQRIESLAIPPAWKHVWICPDPRGHIQATGRDARGRKQYIYHAEWRVVRDEAKYGRLLEFARRLGRLRRRTRRDLRRPELCKEKVLAAVVQLMEATLMRVGNEEYARTNHSFGITTLRGKHVQVRGATIRFRFRGKSGILHDLDLRNRRLARVVKACQELPGETLFEFASSDGAIHPIRSEDVNAYLREATGIDCTAKDLRTWAGTVSAAAGFSELAAFSSPTGAKRNVSEVMAVVAKRLGNTKAVCRRCYVHPGVIETYLSGALAGILDVEAIAERRGLTGLTKAERAVFGLLLRISKRKPRLDG
jgi:DNA topoisomerase I